MYGLYGAVQLRRGEARQQYERNTKGLTGAPVAPWRARQKNNFAPTPRQGAKLLSDARCSEGLRMRPLGAALSNRSNEKTRLSLWFLCSNAARITTVTMKINFGNTFTPLSASEIAHKSHALVCANRNDL